MNLINNLLSMLFTLDKGYKKLIFSNRGREMSGNNSNTSKTV